MADKQLADLTATTTLADTDLLFVETSAGPRKITAANATAELSAVTSVNGETGAVSLSAADVGADAAGTAASAVAAAASSYATAAQGAKADTAVQPTLVDAKGDLLVGSAADTLARLPVGTNDYVLTADSAEATGVKWAAASGGGSTWSTPMLSSVSAAYRYAHFPDQQSSAAIGISGVTANYLYYEPFRCMADCTVTELSIQITQATALATMRLGICEVDEDGVPVALTVDAGTVTAASTGFQKVTGLSAALVAGKTYAKLRITTSSSVQVRRAECGVWGFDPTVPAVLREIHRTSASAEAAGFSSPPPAPNGFDAGSHAGFFHTILMKWTA